MKNIKIIISFLLILLISSVINAQDIKEIEFKFDSMKFTDNSLTLLNNLSKGEFYRIKVTNINLNRYKVLINNSDSVDSKPLELPLFSNFPLESFSSIIAGLSEIGTDGGIIKVLPESYTSKDTLVTEMDNTNDWLNRHKVQIQYFGDELYSIKDEIDSLIEKINIVKIKLLTNDGSLKNKPDIFTFIKKFRDINNQLNSLYYSSRDSQSEFLLRVGLQDNPYEEIKNKIKLLSVKYEKLIEYIVEIKNTLNAKNTAEIISPLAYLKSGNEYVSMPIQYIGDWGSVSLGFTPRNEEFFDQDFTPSEYKFPLQKKSYFAIGFSFYNAGFNDEGYTTIGEQQNDSTIIYSIIEENPGRNEMGVNALLRYGSKLDKDYLWGIHFALGPGISLSNKIKPRVLVGGGFSFGQKHNLSLDGGVIIGSNNIRSNGYNLNDEYTVKPVNVTVSQMQTSWFVSLGYFFKL